MEEEKIVIVYEEHYGRTGAETTFKFDPKPLTEPIFVGGGTHRKYLTIVRKGTTATVKRISNRGNIRIMKITIDKPMFIDFLGGTEPLDEKYIEYARDKGLI